MKCACSDVFVLTWGENVASKLFLFGTNWFPPHSFVPTPVLPSFHDLTSACKHVLPPIAEKFRLLFFSTIQTNHNSQSTTYCYLVLWGALECDLSWLVLPWGRTSAPLKICPFWQNLHLSDKSFALVFAIVRQNVSRVQRGPIIRQLLLCFPELFDKFQVSKNVFALVFYNKWHTSDEIYQLLQNLSASANWPYVLCTDEK